MSWKFAEEPAIASERSGSQAASLTRLAGCQSASRTDSARGEPAESAKFATANPSFGGLADIPLFAGLVVYHDQVPRIASMNMAVDEALLQFATTPTIRFYHWDHPALSFGYFGRFDDVANHARERELVRRWTGGGIVCHGDDLTYSIVIPSSERVPDESSMSIYEKVHRALCEALVEAGQPAVVAGGDDSARRYTSQTAAVNARGGSCFSNPVRADVILNGQKIAGAAQRRTRRGLLQQGSIQNVDLGDGLAERFARALSQQIETQTIDRALIEQAKKIAREKYASEAWLRKR